MKPILKNKGTRIVTGIMLILAAAGIAIAWLYYTNINKSVDPRIKHARLMYGRYNTYAADNDHEKVLLLLDSISEVYASVPHYRNSYEMGVIQNNRASVFLSMALLGKDQEEFRHNFFALAELYLVEGIDYYTNWMRLFGSKTEQELMLVVEKEFSLDEALKNDRNLHAIIRNRVNEMRTAQIETPRRLSVSYTNLGIIRRHQDQLEEAYDYYAKALELWEENHAAKNNMKILFGQPPEEQSFFRKLFPPDRN